MEVSYKAHKRKRTSISLETKLKIFAERDMGKSNTEISNEFKLNLSTVSNILTSRVRVEESASSLALTRKTMRTSQYPELEEELFSFLKRCRSENLPVSGPLLMEKAKSIAFNLNIPDFSASEGWLGRFKKRHNICALKSCGKKERADTDTVSQWHETNKEIINFYGPDNTYNANETGLFYRALPESTLVLKGTKCHGGSRSKERITVLLCCNQSGTDKLEPYVIGKTQKPRCFKEIKVDRPSCQYEANIKAWMTKPIFRRFLISLQEKMALENRNILLIISNCSAHNLFHSLDIKFPNVLIVHLPPNSTSFSQPLDRGIIKSFKYHYRYRLVKYCLQWIEQGRSLQKMPKWNPEMAVNAVIDAWRKVSAVIIQNCWKSAGFNLPLFEMGRPESLTATSSIVLAPVGLAADFRLYMHHVGKQTETTKQRPVILEEYVSIDNDCATCDGLYGSGDDQSTPSTSSAPGNWPGIEAVSDDEDQHEPSIPPPPSRADVMSALHCLNVFHLHHNMSPTFGTNLDSIETDLKRKLGSTIIQSQITDYFSK